MLGLLVLSLALSAPAAAASADASTVQAVPSGQPDSLMTVETASPRSIDNMELHPSSDVCYKIRAYVFSQDANPKFLRETTCGPKVSQTRKTHGYKPTVVVPEKIGAEEAQGKK
jgi:hypothetical protein